MILGASTGVDRGSKSIGTVFSMANAGRGTLEEKQVVGGHEGKKV